jgi:hypothetical protein
MLSALFGGKRRALHFLLPVVKDRVRKLNESKDDPVNVPNSLPEARLLNIHSRPYSIF